MLLLYCFVLPFLLLQDYDCKNSNRFSPNSFYTDRHINSILNEWFHFTCEIVLQIQIFTLITCSNSRPKDKRSQLKEYFIFSYLTLLRVKREGYVLRDSIQESSRPSSSFLNPNTFNAQNGIHDSREVLYFYHLNASLLTSTLSLLKKLNNRMKS